MKGKSKMLDMQIVAKSINGVRKSHEKTFKSYYTTGHNNNAVRVFNAALNHLAILIGRELKHKNSSFSLQNFIGDCGNTKGKI